MERSPRRAGRVLRGVHLLEELELPVDPHRGGARVERARLGVLSWRDLDGHLLAHAHFGDLVAVVNHDDNFMGLRLDDVERRDLVEFLKSL